MGLQKLLQGKPKHLEWTGTPNIVAILVYCYSPTHLEAVVATTTSLVVPFPGKLLLFVLKWCIICMLIFVLFILPIFYSSVKLLNPNVVPLALTPYNQFPLFLLYILKLGAAGESGVVNYWIRIFYSRRQIYWHCYV